MEIISLNTAIKNLVSTGLTADATANVDSAWKELSPLSTILNYNSAGFYLWSYYSDSTKDFWIDIGISNDGGINIIEIFSDLRIYKAGFSPLCLYVPIEIPRGYSLYGRVKTSQGGGTINIFIYPHLKSFYSFPSCLVYKRYDISVNTDGFSTIYEIVNPVPFDVKYIIVSSSVSFLTNPSEQYFYYKLYTGQAGSETEIMNRGFTAFIASDDNIYFSPNGFYTYIPKGERLSISHDTYLTTETRVDYSIYLFG